MTKDEKLQILLNALKTVTYASEDELTRLYCATIIIEVGEEDCLNLVNPETDPTLT